METLPLPVMGCLWRLSRESSLSCLLGQEDLSFRGIFKTNTQFSRFLLQARGTGDLLYM
jgi:hypothetical protein